MNYFIYPIKDATIFEKYPKINTGLDEIIEINKDFDLYNTNKAYNSRILMQFDQDEINDIISNENIINPNFNLILHPAMVKNIPFNTTLNVNPILTDWNNGYSKKSYNEQSFEGVSWNNSDTNIPWNITGSDYSNEISSSVTLKYNKAKLTDDITINITPIVNEWLTGSLANNGIVIKKDNILENNLDICDTIKFYSLETNTIYVPKLSISWDDSIINSGSLSEIDLTNSYICLENLNTKYNRETNKIRIFIKSRENYPEKKFADNITYNSTVDESNYYRYDDIKILPEDSYYAIYDVITNKPIIPFSDFTKISRNNNKNYFDIYINKFMPKRNYEIKLKLKDSSKNTVIIEKHFIFEVD